jgi:hypothetical protein
MVAGNANLTPRCEVVFTHRSGVRTPRALPPVLIFYLISWGRKVASFGKTSNKTASAIIA